MWYLLVSILELITCWCLFKKYNEPGWKGIIPFYKDFIEFDKVWSNNMAWFYVIADIAYIILSSCFSGDDTSTIITIVTGAIAVVLWVIKLIFANKKAKAFGGAIGMTIVLWFFPFIGNLVLAFNNKYQYKGRA